MPVAHKLESVMRPMHNVVCRLQDGASVMFKADVYVGRFNGVVAVDPRPLAVSSLLGLSEVFALSSSVAFFHWSTRKITFISCNSHKLFTGYR